MLNQVPGEEHAGLDPLPLKPVHHLLPGEAAAGAHREQETEPGGVGTLSRLRQHQALFQPGEAVAQQLPVPFPRLDEARKLLQLGAADGGLHVGDLQVVAEVRIDVLVIVAEG